MGVNYLTSHREYRQEDQSPAFVAGSLIRCCLATRPSSIAFPSRTVTIAVPFHLIGQWRAELSN